MAKFLLSAAGGLLLGLFVTASPLTVVSLAAAAALMHVAGRGLDAGERRTLTGILAAAVLIRIVLVMAMVVTALPSLNDLAIGALGGDDAYYLGRALRARDLLFGFAGGKYDYFVVLDEYGRTSYLQFLSLIQIVFGPTPFSMRVLNAVFYLAGAVLLFRVARPAFGRTAAFAGLVVLLFMPSLLWVSVSLLKESLYFLCSALLVYCCARIVRKPDGAAMAAVIVLAALSLWLLNDLRRGALALSLAGLAIAMALRFAFITRLRFAMVAAIAAVGLVAALAQPAIEERAIGQIEAAAKMHGGHVFTVGHPYKLLDEGFYKNPAAPMAWPLELTAPQAGRFLVRAVISFLVTPWPWEMSSLGELMFLPEQLLWYGLVLALPAGIIAGWRRDPATTALLLGYTIPAAAAIALTNGNIGTLLRMRGLITPYLIWIGVYGLLAMADRALERQRPGDTADGSQGWALEGPTA